MNFIKDIVLLSVLSAICGYGASYPFIQDMAFKLMQGVM
jgi:hypothetical protein